MARPEYEQEAREGPEAQAALEKEWDRLRRIRGWGEQAVRECANVEREARSTGTTEHIARIFAIYHGKNAELEKGHPNRKLKGLYLSRQPGWDQDGCDAIFVELSSSPATMEASKIVDTYGLF